MLRLLAVAVGGTALGLALALSPEPPQLPAASCTATSCNFHILCDEDYANQDCCPNGTKAPGCFGICPDTHCGQVDAAPAIPPALFKPEHSRELSEYISFTEGIQMQDPFCGGAASTFSGANNPKLGNCASQGYKYKHANEPGRRIVWAGYPHGTNPNFSPSVVFEKACLAGCGCCANTTTQANPGSLPECAAGGGSSNTTAPPTCGDTPGPNAPEWCGVCGPTLNADRDVDFYFATRVRNVCEPRTPADTALCAAATEPLACLVHPLRCAWRAPSSLGRCVLGNSTTCDANPAMPHGGVFCGATCVPSFDCAKCRTLNRKDYHGPLEWFEFQSCCDGCEWCVATGNGTYTNETACAKDNGDQDHPCVWRKNV